MKAIVLTYDARRVVVDHMIYKYDELWPSHPFTFRVPYQSAKVFEHPLRNEKSVEYIKSPKFVTATIFKLLEGLDLDEWIYWCIDDYYPLFIDVPRIEATVKFLQNLKPNHVGWISLNRLQFKNLDKFIHSDINLQDSYRNNYYLCDTPKGGFWYHCFIRVRNFKRILITNKDMLYIDDLPLDSVDHSVHKRYIISDPIIELVETSFRARKNNKWTGKNSIMYPTFYKSLVDNDFPIPDTLTILGKARSSDDTIYKNLTGQGLALWARFLRVVSSVRHKIFPRRYDS